MPDLGDSLRELVEGSLLPLEVDAVVARRRRVRTRRRVAMSALAIAALLGSIGFGVRQWGSDGSGVGTRIETTNPSSTAAPPPAQARGVLISPGGGSSALFGLPQGTLPDVTILDVASGAARRHSLPLPHAQSALQPYLVRGNDFVVVLNPQRGPYDPSIGAAYAVSAALNRAVALGHASFVFASVNPDRVWLETDNSTPDQRLHYHQYGSRRTVAEVDLGGHATSPVYELTDDRSPIAAVTGGLVTVRPPNDALEIWNPVTNRAVQRLGVYDGFVSASGSVVLQHSGTCQPTSSCPARVTDLRTNRHVVINAPSGMQLSQGAEGTVAISPDGTRVAMVAHPIPTPAELRLESHFGPPGYVVPGTQRSVLEVFDVATGRRLASVDYEAWRGGTSLGWSSDSSFVFFTRDANHVGYISAATTGGSPEHLNLPRADAFLVLAK
jgi:hypothetical protein